MKRLPSIRPGFPIGVITIVLVATVLSVACGATSTMAANDSQAHLASAWLITTRVIYQANHDPAVIQLNDGRQLQVVYGKVSWQEVDTWEIGRPLLLVYGESRGAHLIDPKSGGELPIIGGFGDRHPLDELCAQELDLDPTTMGMVAAYRRSTAKWMREIDRLYQALLSSHVLPETATALRASRQAWLDGRRAHVEAAGALWGRPRGTIWQLSGASHVHGLTRNHAFFLMKLVEPAIAGSEP